VLGINLLLTFCFHKFSCIHQIDHKVVKKKFKLSSLLHNVKKRDKNNTQSTMIITTTEMKTTENIFFETTTVPFTNTPAISSLNEGITDLPPQYLLPFDFKFHFNKTNDFVTPSIEDETDEEDEKTTAKLGLSAHESFNIKDKLIQSLKILTILKSSTNKNRTQNIENNIFPYFTTTLPLKLEDSSSNRNTNSCVYNETRLLVSYSNTDIILCRNESWSNRMNCIDKKLKRRIQDKIRGIYRIQMVSNYFIPSTFNCSSLLNNIKRKNITLAEIPALLNTNYTVCSFLNASKENRIKILWKLYIVSEECYRVENASFFPFRNMSMRIQTYDAGK
jgi:hypothetical protein